MSVTKSNSSDTANTVTAGTTEASPFTSTAVDLSAAHGAFFNVFLTNGATGPTVGAKVKLQVSHDAGTTWVDDGYPTYAGVTANGVYGWRWEFGENAPSQVRFAAFNNTGQNVTLDVYWTLATAIA